jgi:hypothetical protein
VAWPVWAPALLLLRHSFIPTSPPNWVSLGCLPSLNGPLVQFVRSNRAPTSRRTKLQLHFASCLFKDNIPDVHHFMVLMDTIPLIFICITIQCLNFLVHMSCSWNWNLNCSNNYLPLNTAIISATIQLTPTLVARRELQ